MIRAAALLIALVPVIASAEEPVQQVTGLHASNVLDVRRAPSANAPIVGALSPLADFVMVRERRGDWARIEQARGVTTPVRGWVEARYLEPSTSEVPPNDGAWVCSGDEPIFSVWIEGGEVRYFDVLDTNWTPLVNVRRVRNGPGTSWSFNFGIDGDRLAIMLAGTVCEGLGDDTSRRSLLLVGREGGLLNGCCGRPGSDDPRPERLQADPPQPDPPQPDPPQEE